MSEVWPVGGFLPLPSSHVNFSAKTEYAGSQSGIFDWHILQFLGHQCVQ